LARFCILILIVGFWVAPAAAGEDSADSTSIDQIQLSTILPTGMRVVVTSLPEAALTRVGMFYAAGSALEPDSLAGLTHLCEHILTESSLNHPDGGLIRQQTLYCTFRNAYTGPAYMQFDSECLPEFLPVILELEADRLRGVVTDSVSFAREKAVVLEELAMRRRLPPVSEFLESVFFACYPGHPFGRGIGGTAASVGRIQLEDFHAFQDEYIQPRRASLVVKGPGDPAAILAEIERVFGTGPPGEPVLAEYPPKPPLGADQFIADSHDHTGMLLSLTFRVQLADRTDAAWAEVLPSLMKQDGMDPLVRTMPGEAVFQIFSQSKYTRPSENPQDHWGRIYYDFDPEQQSLRYMGYLWEDLDDFVNDLRKPKVLDARLGRAIKRLGSTGRNPGQSTGEGAALVNGNEYLTPDTVREILRDAGPDDFLGFMGKWFNTDHVVVGVSHGRDSERQATLTMPRSAADEPAGEAESALETLTLADIQPVLEVYGQSDLIRLDRFNLFNGTPVFCLDIPQADIWSLAGARTFPPIKDMGPGKKPGVVQVFNQVVNYDDKQRNDPNRSRAPKRLPYGLRFSLSWNAGSFSAHGPADKIDNILEAVDARVTSREFNNIRWYSMMNWGEDYLENFRGNKTYAARAWRWEQLLGPKSPSLGEWAPDPAAFDRIKYKDLVKLHQDYIAKTGDLQLFVAGDIPADQVQTVLNRTFGRQDRWKAPRAEESEEIQLPGIRGRIVPDLTRGDVRLEITFPIRTAPASGDPAMTTLILNQALQDGLTDRLREKEGLTYWVGVFIFPVPGGQLWEISITCQPGQAPRVLELVGEELDDFDRQGFSEDAVARARLQLTGEAIRMLTDRDSGVDYLRHLAELGGVPRDVLLDISRVTADQVNLLAERVIDPSHFVFTATGPLLEDDLEKFDLP